MGEETARRGIPRITDHVIALPRVLQVLDAWAPVTILQGMRGYGKTTQIAAWLRELRPAPEILWLNASDDPLLRDLSTWVERGAHLAESPGGRADAARRTVIVIDNAHEVVDRSALQRAAAIVERRQDVHLVGAARGRPTIQRVLDGRVHVAVVAGGDLLLREAEIAALAARMEVSLTGEQIARLRDEFGGWPAAVRLVLDEMPAAELPITRAERYLRESVLPEWIDTRLLTLSLRFSLAERLTHQLIRDLADDTPPDEAIAALEEPGYVGIRHLSDDVELVLPGFVRRVLQREFSSGHPRRARDMHQRLAAWYDAHPGPDHELHALRHAAAARSWPLFQAVWDKAGPTLAVHHPGAMRDLLRELPLSVVKKHPGVAVVRGSLAAAQPEDLPATQLAAARAKYPRLCAAADPQTLVDLPLPDMLVIGAGHVIDLRRRGLVAQAEAQARRLDEALERRLDAGESAGDQLHWYYLQRGIDDLLCLRYAEALHWHQLSWRHCGRPESVAALVAASQIALAYVLIGRHREASTWIRQHRAHANGGFGPSRMSDATATVAATLVALDRLDHGVARLPRDDALEFPDNEFWAFAAYARARHDLIADRPAAGLRAVEDAVQDHRDDRSTASTLLLARVRAELLIAMGQGHHASQMLVAAGVHEHPMLVPPFAWIHLLSGATQRARQVAVRALPRQSAASDRIELMLVAALAALRDRDALAGAHFTSQAVVLSEQSGVIRPFTLVPKADLAQLLAEAGCVLSRHTSRRLAEFPSPYPGVIALVWLTPREQQLVAALNRADSRNAIAEEMFVSINTVKKQLATLYRKLGVTTRGDALARIEQLGLLDNPERPAHRRIRPSEGPAPTRKPSRRP